MYYINQDTLQMSVVALLCAMLFALLLIINKQEKKAKARLQKEKARQNHARQERKSRYQNQANKALKKQGFLELKARLKTERER